MEDKNLNEKKMITAKDIAKACGISQATVSYVINNKEGKKISDKTRELVLETAKKLDYTPNSSARTMRTNRAMSIGVVVGRNCINIGFNKVLRGIKNYTDTIGYSITLLNEDENSINRIQEYLGYFRSNKIDGLLFMFYDMNEDILKALQDQGIPYLIINENGVWGKTIEHKKAFTQVIKNCTKFCKDNNLAKIGFMSISRKGNTLSYKYELFKEALEENFSEAKLERIFLEGDNEQLMEQLEHYVKENFDIIITPNQRLGVLVQSAILKTHLAIPQKVKHICLGASHIFRMMYPTVTSVKIPLEEMGEYGARVLLAMIFGKSFEEKDFECTLEYGMSTQLE